MNTLLLIATLFMQDIFVPFFDAPAAPAGFETFATWATGTISRNNSDNRVGHRFTPSVNMTVTQIGRWKIAGNTGTTTLYIQTVAGTVLGSVVLDYATATVGQINYVALGTPVALTAGTQYAIISKETSGANFFGDTTGNTYTFNMTHITAGTIFAGSVPAAGGAFTGAVADKTFGPMSARYTVP